MKTPFESQTYRDFLRSRLEDDTQSGRGARTRLAQAMNCQLSYVSLVLSEQRELSSDQLIRAAQYYRLTQAETEYLLLLLERERSGSREAKNFYSELLRARLDGHNQMRSRMKVDQDLSESDKATYYSEPGYAAIHMLVTIPGEWTNTSISKRLKMDLQKTSQMTAFLSSRSLLKEQGGKFKPGTQYLFLSKESPLISQHHANWRLHAIEHLRSYGPRDTHLSLAVTLSQDDVEKLRTRIGEFVAEISSTIKQSKEEELMVFNLDFYRV
jgi:hypothetical protein